MAVNFDDVTALIPRNEVGFSTTVKTLMKISVNILIIYRGKKRQRHSKLPLPPFANEEDDVDEDVLDRNMLR